MKEITKEELATILCENLQIRITSLQNKDLQIIGIDETVDKIYSAINKPEPKKFEVWKPKDGDTYYYVTSGGTATKTFYTNSDFDNQAYSIGNCYKTEQEALNHAAHLKAKKKLQDELAVMNAEANGGVEFDKNLAEYWLHWNGEALDNDGCFASEFPLHVRIHAKFDYETTIGTLTKEEVRLAFGVFE